MEIDIVVDYNKEIGDRIKAIRQKMGLSQTAFIEQLDCPGCSQPSLTRFEAGTRMPDALVVKRIAEVFNVSMLWLMTGIGEM